MKINALFAIVSLAIIASAQAGEEASAKHVVAPPAPSCLWSWFAGGSVGIIDGDDWDEEIYTLHVGMERKCAGDDCSHAFYLEVGYTEQDESTTIISESEGPNINSSSDTEVIPITLNYKYECGLTDSFNWYAGAGAGIALVDLEGNETIGQTDTSFSDDDTVFYAHIFAGLVYNISEAFEIFGGARYIFMDDVDLDGETSNGPLDEELHYELGARFNF